MSDSLSKMAPVLGMAAATWHPCQLFTFVLALCEALWDFICKKCNTNKLYLLTIHSNLTFRSIPKHNSLHKDHHIKETLVLILLGWGDEAAQQIGGTSSSVSTVSREGQGPTGRDNMLTW